MILVVEDEPAIREMVEAALIRAGFTVRGAADTNEADSALGERLPDLVLLDWMLPGTNGIDYARRLKRDELTREIPLIMLTERVFTRSQLLDRVWGSNVYVEERTVDVHVRRLRKALSPFGLDRFIQTVHGTGYRFSRQPA